MCTNIIYCCTFIYIYTCFIQDIFITIYFIIELVCELRSWYTFSSIPSTFEINLSSKPKLTAAGVSFDLIASYSSSDFIIFVSWGSIFHEPANGVVIDTYIKY